MEGVGNAGCPLHPRPRVHFVLVESTRATTSTPESPGIPARNGFTAYVVLPGDRALLPPSSRGYLTCPNPVGPTCLPQNLTPASGRQDHTILPSAATSLVSMPVIAHKSFDQPCDPIARKTLPRPPHPVPYVRDDRETPLCVGRDGQSSRGDLGGAKTEIFLQTGLDYPNQIDLFQQIAFSERFESSSKAVSRQEKSPRCARFPGTASPPMRDPCPGYVSVSFLRCSCRSHSPPGPR
jgi:hypothetical protein